LNKSRTKRVTFEFAFECRRSAGRVFHTDGPATVCRILKWDAGGWFRFCLEMLWKSVIIQVCQTVLV